MLARRLALLAAGPILAGAIAGCGGGLPGPGANELAATDAANVLDATRTIRRACDGDAASRAGIPDAVSTLRSTTEESFDRVYQVGSGQRAIALYEYSLELAGTLRACGFGGDAQALETTAREARDAARAQ